MRKSLNLKRGVVWCQDLQRMRMERYYHRCSPNLLRPANEIMNQILMTEVKSIEIPNRYYGKRVFGDEILQTGNYLILLVLAMNSIRSS